MRAGVLAGSLMTALVIASNASAGSCNGCAVLNLGVGPYYDALCTSSKCVFVKLQSVSSKPSCASNSYWDFALDTSTDSGRAAFAFLLTAHETGRLLAVGGTNLCTLSPSGVVENLNWMNFAE